MIWVSIIAIIVLALLGAPLFAVVLAAAMLGFLATDINLSVVAIEIYRITDTPLLVALPLYISIATTDKLTSRLRYTESRTPRC